MNRRHYRAWILSQFKAALATSSRCGGLHNPAKEGLWLFVVG